MTLKLKLKEIEAGLLAQCKPMAFVEAYVNRYLENEAVLHLTQRNEVADRWRLYS
jgi:hypothetical protein